MSLKRLAPLTLGYLGAVAVAGIVTALPLLVWMLWPLSGVERDSIADALGVLTFHWGLIGIFSFIPAVLGIVAAERFAMSSPLGYALGGVGVGLVGLASMTVVSAPAGAGVADMVRVSLIGHAVGFFVTLVLVAGASAGLVFWLVTVRWARSRQATPARTAASEA